MPENTDIENTDIIKVMLVDDSAVVRGFISRIIEQASDIKVVGSYVNGKQAVDVIGKVNPDIIIMDVEMPVMDGITALPLILQKDPKAKVLMCSTLTTQNADISMRAFELGALDCIGKPTAASQISSDTEFQDSLFYKIRNIARPGTGRKARRPEPEAKSDGFLVKPKKHQRSPEGIIVPPKHDDSKQHDVNIAEPSQGRQEKSFVKTPRAVEPRAKTSYVAKSLDLKKKHEAAELTLQRKASLDNSRPKILAVGSSTGGPQALFKFLGDLKLLNIPVVVTQHMPATFTRILAEHISQHTGHNCVEAEEGMAVEAGKIYVAPGGYHMLFKKDAGKLVVKLDDGPAENFCKPAVDPMIRSLQSIYGSGFVSVILTGMGADGLNACTDFVAKGGRLIAQDEETSVVWGMPGAVAEAGLCMEVLPLDQMGSYVGKLI